MTIWFPGWILIFSWEQLKEQELATGLLAEGPCSCGTEQCPQEEIPPALHLAAWMMLQPISSSWMCSGWDRKATPVGKQLLLFSLTPTRHKSYPFSRANLVHPFGRIREVRRWMDVSSGESCHGNDGGSVQWHLSCCGGLSPADQCASRGWAAPRGAKHQMASPRAELLAQCHHSVNSFGAGPASSSLHAGDKAQAQWLPFSPCQDETGLEAENGLNTFWAITTASGN